MANYIQKFDSLQKLYEYLCDTPFNEVFRWAEHSSVKADNRNWSQTRSFEEAVDLLRNGWDDMSKKLTQKLAVACKNMQPQKAQRNVLSVAGYQPVVALYLAGVPQNMIDKQTVVKKQKIIELTKDVTYSACVSSEEIIEESIKSMMIVKKLEAQGFRVKLNIALGVEADGRKIICKACVKQPGDRLNISKLAFPMVHPSMLRRLFFRYIEVNPDVTSGFRYGYGRPIGAYDMKRVFKEDIILPNHINVDIENIKNAEELIAAI